MTPELVRQYMEFFAWAVELLSWAMLALISLTSLLIAFVVVLLISNRKEVAKMEENLLRLEKAASSLADNAATALIVVAQLKGAKFDLETLVADLRKQLSEGGQIDPLRLDAVSETLERTDGLIRGIFTPAPGEQPPGEQPPASEGEGASVIDIARANERAAQGSTGSGSGGLSTGNAGAQPPGTVTSEADGG